MADPLDDYRRMRDFGATPEPRGDELKGDQAPPARRGARLFVIQKHAASHLHYDLRLEHRGTLKSWAVPKGPSLDASISRLAVEVEDHPIEYGGFEGVIPEGEYGGGTVLLWDRGRWTPLDPKTKKAVAEGDGQAGADAVVDRGLETGKLYVRFEGRKLRGVWRLVRTDGGSGRAKSRRKPQWLLRKVDGSGARPEGEGEGEGAIVDERPESVLSGLTIEQLAERPGRVWVDGEAQVHPSSTDPSAVDPSRITGARPASLRVDEPPEPQLARRVDAPPAGDGWIHELKLDGYRVLCTLAEGGRVRITTRNGLDWTGKLAPVAAAVDTLPVREALVDGEIVVLDADGRSDFGALQDALSSDQLERLTLYAFDLLHLDGFDLRSVPIETRKEMLAGLLATTHDPRLRLSEHVRGRGAEVLQGACALGAEGVISKRFGSAYRGGRGRDWLKSKCLERQEVIVVGFTEPSGSRAGLGALLAAVHDRQSLRYAGRVGSGFDRRTLLELRARLDAIERDESPLPTAERPRLPGVPLRDVHWVAPELVAEVRFTGWTRDGRMRHPVFVGLRDDKPPSEVVRESPEQAPTTGKAPEVKTTTMKKPKKTRKTLPRRGSRRPGAPIEIAGVRLTSPDKVLYPEQGVTKRHLAEHYVVVAERMLPLVGGRPLSLVRCPDGLGLDGIGPNGVEPDGRRDCFYQKHLDPMPSELRAVPIVEKDGGETRNYAAVDDVAGLVALAQLGVLEIHPWGSTVDDLEQPDRWIFDLDPDEALGWPTVVDAARSLRDLLADLGLESFPMLTGGKGLHVVVPVEPSLEWSATKRLTRALAELLAREDPERFTLDAAKRKRRGKIFIDYLRNGRGATAIGPYSPRARSSASVATPIGWRELTATSRPKVYGFAAIRRRIQAQSSDPWERFIALRQRLDPAILQRV